MSHYTHIFEIFLVRHSAGTGIINTIGATTIVQAIGIIQPVGVI
jgi:hypothetical protein